MEKLKLIKYGLVSFIFYILSYIVPKNPKLIIFGASHGSRFSGNPKYAYLTALKNENYKTIWITKNEKLLSEMRKKGLKAEYSFSFRGLVYILLAKYMFFDYDPGDMFFWPFLFGRFKTINTWHSVPIKLMGNDEKKQPDRKSLISRIYLHLNRVFGFNKKHYEVMISTSDFSSGNLRTGFSPKKIILSGYPENDILFDKFLSFENIREKLNLRKYSKIFFYAPTLREETTIKPFSKSLKAIDNYLLKSNHVLLIKKHPSTKDLVVDSYKRIIDISNEVVDAQEILKEADVFITDYSGIMVDFVLTGKPIILYCYDLEDYKKNRGFYIDFEKLSPGLLAKNEDQLLNYIKNIDKLFKRKEIKDKYKRFKDTYQKYSDGNSSKRLLNSLGVN